MGSSLGEGGRGDHELLGLQSSGGREYHPEVARRSTPLQAQWWAGLRGRAAGRRQGSVHRVRWPWRMRETTEREERRQKPERKDGRDGATEIQRPRRVKGHERERKIQREGGERPREQDTAIQMTSDIASWKEIVNRNGKPECGDSQGVITFTVSLHLPGRGRPGPHSQESR